MATLTAQADLTTSFSAECFDSHIAHRVATRTQSTDTRLPIWIGTRQSTGASYDLGNQNLDYILASQNHYLTDSTLAKITDASSNNKLIMAFDLLDIHPDSTINSVTFNIRAKVDTGTLDFKVLFGSADLSPSVGGISPTHQGTIDTTLATHTITISSINQTVSYFDNELYFHFNFDDNIVSQTLEIAQISASVNYTGRTLRKTEIKTLPYTAIDEGNVSTGDHKVRTNGWNWSNLITDDDDFEIKNIYTTQNYLNVNLRTYIFGSTQYYGFIVAPTETGNQTLTYERDTDDAITTITGATQHSNNGDGNSPIQNPKESVATVLYDITDFDDVVDNRNHPIYTRYPSAIPSQATLDTSTINHNYGIETMWQDYDTTITAQDLRTSTYTVLNEPVLGSSNQYDSIFGGRSSFPQLFTLNRYFNPNQDTDLSDTPSASELLERGFGSALVDVNSVTRQGGFFRQGIGFEIGPRGIVSASSVFDFTASAQNTKSTTAPLNISATVTTLGGFIVLGSLDFGKYLADDYVATDYIREDSQGAESDFDIGLAGLVFAGSSTMASAVSTSLTAELSIEGGAEPAFATTLAVAANNTLRVEQFDIDFDTNITALGGFDIQGTAAPQTQFAVADLDDDDVLIIQKPMDSHVFTEQTETRTYTIPGDLRTYSIETQTRTHQIPTQIRTITVEQQTRTTPAEGL